jgi:hypothetical protein
LDEHAEADLVLALVLGVALVAGTRRLRASSSDDDMEDGFENAGATSIWRNLKDSTGRRNC